VCQSMSSSEGGVIWLSLRRPIKAMSLLKSPHRVYMWSGWSLICCVIVCCISGMYGVSLTCDGILKSKNGCNGEFFILIICKYGEIIAGVGIFVIFPGYAYFCGLLLEVRLLQVCRAFFAVYSVLECVCC
jgi:hypothetical protein